MRNAFRRSFYAFVVTSLRLLLTTAARVHRVGLAPLPEGAFVLASNHISHFDPPILSGWVPRKIDWMAMAELFSKGWSHKAFTWLDVIPVDRGGDDRQALRHALRRLEDGRVMGVFPEGGIRDGENSILAGAPFREGAVMLAAHAGCPIVPVVLLGTDRLYNKNYWLKWRRASVYLAWGRPIVSPEGLSRGAAREHLRKELAAAILSLKEEVMTRFQLTDDDLPKPPRERMKEP